VECVRLRSASVVLVSVSALLAGCTLVPPQDEVSDSGSPEKAAAVGECPWESDGSAAPAADDGTRTPREATEAIALSDERFWQLVESIPAAPQAPDFEEASRSLAGCSMGEIVGFDARLTLALYDLDGPENLAWFEQNDPLGLGFASDDAFLYARCASVLGGQESWASAVEQGTLDWGQDEPDVDGVSERLLWLALDAALAQGLTEDEYLDLQFDAIPLSYESGSNKDRWGDAAAI